MSNFLADTSLLIDLINDRSSRRDFVRLLLGPGDTLGCCPINIIEVYTGMRPGEEQATEQWFDRLIYYGVDQAIAKRAGALRFRWRQKGQTLLLADATIAAVALHYDLVLLTDNQKHFPMPEINRLNLPTLT